MKFRILALLWAALLSSQVFALNDQVKAKSCDLPKDEVITVG